MAVDATDPAEQYTVRDACHEIVVGEDAQLGTTNYLIAGPDNLDNFITRPAGARTTIKPLNGGLLFAKGDFAFRIKTATGTVNFAVEEQ